MEIDLNGDRSRLLKVGVFFALCCFFLTACTRGPLVFTVDLAEESEQVLEDKFTMLISWNYNPHWTTDPLGYPAHHIARRYPYMREVELLAATGGCYFGHPGCPAWEARDLFVNPRDRENLTDYRFDPLVAAVGNILRQGLRPYIVIGMIPLKLSSEPELGAFSMNVRPPDDIDAHSEYVRALVELLIERFGLETVRQFRWGVLPEIENADWFYDGVSAESTKQAYFELYDKTVHVLQELLGGEHLTVGAHAMAVMEGLWDPGELLDHVAYGTNYATGATGTQLDFFAVSYYEKRPGSIYGKERDLAAIIHRLRERAEANGLDLRFGVNEGRMLSGIDRKPLISRAVASSYQSAYDARLLRQLHDLEVDWFAVWSLHTEGHWRQGLPTVSHHLFSLAHRAHGAKRLTLQQSGRAKHRSNEVDGLVGYDEETHTLRLLLYNFAVDPDATTSETVEVIVENIRPMEGGTVHVTQWLIDDNHGNFWPAWWEEVGSHLGEEGYNDWSAYSPEVATVVTDFVALRRWTQMQPALQRLAELTPTEKELAVEDDRVRLNITLEHHGIAYIEVGPVVKVERFK